MKWLSSVFLLCFALNGFSQNIFIENNQWNYAFRYQQNQKITHGIAKPYTTFNSTINRDTLESLAFGKQRKTWLGRKLKEENLVELKTKDLFLTSDPLVYIQQSREQGNPEQLKQNTRGVMITGQIGDKLHFYTSFYENQVFYPIYLTDFVKQHDVAPGYGRVKNFKATGFDFAMASAMISLNINKQFNVQFGNGKNFIGNGYRSLLLSDNSFNYPHLKLSFKSKNSKWLYQSIYSTLIDLKRIEATTSSEPQFYRKFGAFHFIHFIPNSKLSFGLFEGVIYQRQTVEGTLKFNANYLNPVLGFNSLFNGFNKAKTNNLIGFLANYSPFKSVLLYHQSAIGALDNNGFGLQNGIRIMNPFKIKNLEVLVEYNVAGSSLYQQQTGVEYSHYNQQLAFVPINRKTELVVQGYYMFHYFFISGQYNLQSWYGLNRTYLSGNFGYLINPKTGLKISVGFQQRINISYFPLSSKSNWGFIDFSSSLGQRYYDF